MGKNIIKGLSVPEEYTFEFDSILIAPAKSRSARGASHHPAFTSGCLLVTRVCPVNLVKQRCYFGGIYLSLGVGGGVGSWERCMSGARW